MYFEQFYLTCLAHASYMAGSEGVAAVVDPQRDVDLYIQEAARHGLRIAYVIETHLHADFVSGHIELAARTGAEICISHRAGARFAHRAMKEGDELRFGRAVLRWMETPGHTPESSCLLVTDLDRGPQPFAVLTGDTLFIGDVGRPDLSPELTPQQLAALLYDSLHSKLLKLPDQVEVYPAHGAGSLCGRSISSERRSTIGHERLYNYALQPMSREEFVGLLTSDLPERPEYFARDAEINRRGAAPLEALPAVPALSPGEFARRQAAGAVALDTRPAAQFGAGHVPGAVNIGLGGQYASWAARIVGLDRDILLVAEDPERLAESRMRLARVGIERVTGHLQGGILAWQKAGRPLEEIPQVAVHDVHQGIQSGEWQVLDVRREAEWNSAHIAAARLAPLDQLRAAASAPPQTSPLLEGLDPRRPLAVHCKSGYRSSIAASLLRRLGFEKVMNVTGGFDAWAAHKLPQVSGKAPACAASSAARETAPAAKG